MAYVSANPVSVGSKTLKSQYDRVLNDANFLHDSILGVSGDSGVILGVSAAAQVRTFAFEGSSAMRTVLDSEEIRARAGASATGPGFAAHGKSSGTTPGALTLYSGDTGVGTERDIELCSLAGSAGNMAVFNRTTGLTMYTSRIGRDVNSGTLDFSAGTTGVLTDGGIRHFGPTNIGGTHGGISVYLKAESTDAFSLIGIAGSTTLLYWDGSAGTAGKWSVRDKSGVEHILSDFGAKTHDFFDSGKYVTVKLSGDPMVSFDDGTNVAWISSGSSGLSFVADKSLNNGADMSGCNWFMPGQCAGTPSSTSNGMIWYDTNAGLFKCQDSGGVRNL